MIGSTPQRATRWIKQVHRAVEAGDEHKFQEVLGQIQRFDEITSATSSQVYHIIIFARHNQPSKKKRQVLLKIALEHPDVALPTAGHQPVLVAGAIEKKQFGLLPMLHGAGMALLGNDRDRALMTRELAAGRWPYPDLLMPDVLKEMDSPWALVSRLYSKACMQRKFLEKLTRLEGVDQRFVKIASRGMARHGEELDALEQAEPGRAQECIGLLLERGWLDPIVVQEEIDKESIQDMPESLLSMISAARLKRATPQASTAAPRARF